MLNEFQSFFPLGYDAEVYRAVNPDLARLNTQELFEHYVEHGRSEGRVSSLVVTREDFLRLIPPNTDILEIGPFDSPCVTGERVDYLDLMSRVELEDRARELQRNPESVPEIRWIARDGRLDGVAERYDVVVSSHNIEHQTDLVDHFNQVSRILNPGGYYFLIIPDFRYCFDHFLSPSTIAGVLDANSEARRQHSLRSVIEHRVLTTHNDASRHWMGDHGQPTRSPEALRQAMQEHANSPDGVDVHAWQFTPISFVEIVDLLRGLELVRFKTVALYETLRNNFEFKVILQLQD